MTVREDHIRKKTLQIMLESSGTIFSRNNRKDMLKLLRALKLAIIHSILEQTDDNELMNPYV